MVTLLESLLASDFSYTDDIKTGFTDGWSNVTSDYSDTSIYETDLTTNDNGFSATVFQNVNTGEIIVAFRGTDGFNDLDDDAKLSILKDAGQVASANELIDAVIKHNLDAPLHVTGHSLGGYLAQKVMEHVDKINENIAEVISSINDDSLSNMEDYNYIKTLYELDTINNNIKKVA